MEEKVYFMDARTRFLGHQFCSVGEHITEQVEEFIQWTKDGNIKPKDIWYADLFELNGREHVARLTLHEDGMVTINPVPEGEAVNPFKRRYGLLRRILKFVIRLVESIGAVKRIFAKDELMDFLAKALSEKDVGDEGASESNDNTQIEH